MASIFNRKKLFCFSFAFFILIAGYAQENKFYALGQDFQSQGNDITFLNNNVYSLCTSTENNNDIIIHCSSITGHKIWSKVIGSSVSDECNSIISTSDGNLLLCGSTTFNTTDNLQDFLIIKMSPTGNILWKYQFGYLGIDKLSSCAEIGGNYFFSGNTNTNDLSDIIIIKTDLNGTIQWNQLYDINSNENVTKITGANDGSIIVTGNSNNSVLLMKVNSSDGLIIWSNIYNDITTVVGQAVCQLSSGNLIVGTSNGRVLCTDANGDVLWIRTYRNVRSINSLAVENTNTIVFAGTANAPDYDFGGVVDACLGQINVDTGRVIRFIVCGGTEADIFSKVIKVGNDFHLIGQTSSFGYRTSSTWKNTGYAIINMNNPLSCIMNAKNSEAIYDILYSPTAVSFTITTPTFITVNSSGVNVASKDFYIRDVCSDRNEYFAYIYKARYDEAISGLTETGSKNKILAVGTYSNNDEPVSTVGRYYIKSTLTEFDSLGNVNWSKVIAPTNVYNDDLRLRKIQKISKHSYVLAGEYRNGIDAQVCIIKTDHQGNIIFNRKISYVNRSTGDQVRSIVYTPDHNIVVLFNLSVVGTIVKMDTLGNIIWTKTYNAHIHSICAASDSGLFLTYNRQGISIARLDKNGSILWNRGYTNYGLANPETTQIFENLKNEIVVSFTNGDAPSAYGGTMIFRWDYNGTFVGGSLLNYSTPWASRSFYQLNDSSYFFFTSEYRIKLSKNFGYSNHIALNYTLSSRQIVDVLFDKEQKSAFISGYQPYYVPDPPYVDDPNRFFLHRQDSLGYSGCPNDQGTIFAGINSMGLVRSDFTFMEGATQIYTMSSASLAVQNYSGYSPINYCKSCYTYSPQNPGSIIGPSTVCHGETINYSVTFSPKPFTYRWTLGNGFDWNSDDTDNSIDVEAIGYGSHHVQTAVVNRCGQTWLSNILYVYINSVPYFPSISRQDDSLIVNNLVNVAYKWYLDGAIIPDEEDSVLVAVYNGSYVAEVEDLTNHCRESSTPYIINNLINSINDQTRVVDKLIVYPNPSAGVIEINIPETCEILTILDAYGRQLYNLNRKITDQGIKTLSITDLPKGVLFIHCLGDKRNSEIMKLIVY